MPRNPARAITALASALAAAAVSFALSAVTVPVAFAQATKAQRKLPNGKDSPTLPAPTRPAAPRGGGVRPMFDYAMGLYESGKYGQALAGFDALLRKYPSHEPATIQLAKTLYRLDRVRDAQNIFQRVNPQHLDPETSYEYGWSFYTTKGWEGALSAFQRVPRGHALYDLANYYGAICAIKLKKFEDAEDMLEKAVVLPDKLAKSRALYVKHVQALRLMQQKSQLDAERKQEKDKIKDGQKPKPKEDAKPDPNAPYVHQGKRSTKKAASVSYTSEHQYVDKHGLSEETYDAKVATFAFKAGPLLKIPQIKMPKDRYAALGLQLKLAAEDRNTTGIRQRILINESEGDLSRLDRESLGTTHEQSGTVSAEPWIEFPLPEDIWIATGGLIEFTYPEFERGSRYGSRKGYVQLAGVAGKIGFNGEVSYAENLDTKTEPKVSIVNGKSSISGEIATKLTATATVSHTMFDYIKPEIELNGPDGATRFEAELAQGLPIGFSASAVFAAEQQTNSIFYKIPTFGQLAADGRALTAVVTLAAKPVAWFTAEITQLITKTTWKLENESARDAFELNVADYIEEFSATLSLNLDF